MFLDRDGVLNRNVFYPDTGAWEAPRQAGEFVLHHGVVPALRALVEAGFLLILVSNQPNEVKGKSPAGTLDVMHSMLSSSLGAAGVALAESFYCRHHPAVTGACACRKPKPHFLYEAARRFSLQLADCWMIGDRVTDLECGRAAGVHTAWVFTGQEPMPPDLGSFDCAGTSLPGVVRSILCR